MNAEEAKNHFFDHWDYLLMLCGRHFPSDANLAEEASNYVLDELRANDWRRVREWEEQGKFQTFLTVLVNRLLIDFYRQRFGYQRPPKWLKEEIARENEAIEQQRATNNPGASLVSFWQLAYRLLYRDKYSRQEAIERLLTEEPSPERRRVEQMVTMILARCPALIVSPDAPKQPLDELGEVESEQLEPLADCLGEEQRLLEEWAGLILENGNTSAARPISEQLQRIRRSIRLTEEDRLLLRLRYAEGLAVPTIAKMLSLKGDPYKRLGRLLGDLEKTFRQLDLYEVRAQT